MTSNAIRCGQICAGMEECTLYHFEHVDPSLAKAVSEKKKNCLLGRIKKGVDGFTLGVTCDHACVKGITISNDINIKDVLDQPLYKI